MSRKLIACCITTFANVPSTEGLIQLLRFLAVNRKIGIFLYICFYVLEGLIMVVSAFLFKKWWPVFISNYFLVSLVSSYRMCYTSECDDDETNNIKKKVDYRGSLCKSIQSNK